MTTPTPEKTMMMQPSREGGHHHGPMSPEGSGSMMKNHFHVDHQLTILLHFWRTSSPSELLAACVIVYILAVATEAIRAVSTFLIEKYPSKGQIRLCGQKETRNRGCNSGCNCLTMQKNSKIHNGGSNLVNNKRGGRSSDKTRLGEDCETELITSSQTSSYFNVNGKELEESAKNITTEEDEIDVKCHQIPRPPFFDLRHLLKSFLYVVTFTLSYLQMLVVMTFNLYLIVAVLLGVATGHYVCQWFLVCKQLQQLSSTRNT